MTTYSDGKYYVAEKTFRVPRPVMSSLMRDVDKNEDLDDNEAITSLTMDVSDDGRVSIIDYHVVDLDKPPEPPNQGAGE